MVGYPQLALNLHLYKTQHPHFCFSTKESKKQTRKKQEAKSLRMSLVTEEMKAKADEVYYGDEMCQEKSRELLQEMELPNGLLPMKDMEECGIVRETGFVWLKQKKSYTHKFEEIGRPVTYAKEVTAYVEKNKVKKLTGVKAKELLIWLTVSDIYIDDPSTRKITFKSPTGLTRTFPVSAFEVKEEVKDVKEKNNNKEKEVENAAATAIQVKQV